MKVVQHYFGSVVCMLLFNNATAAIVGSNLTKAEMKKVMSSSKMADAQNKHYNGLRQRWHVAIN